MSLVMSLRGRGAAGSAARASMVLARFGATAGPMARRLDRYSAITSELGIRPTWPTTASVLARHPDLLRRYASEGVELALHGLVHGDHGGLDESQQRAAISRAAEIFDRSGLQATGFRGPYLRYNAATLDVLRELGLRYHSSQAVVYPLCGEAEGARQRAYELALELYSARDARRIAVTPKLRSGLVDIPVSIPDDEIIIERLRLDEPARTAQWLFVLDETYRRGDLFTLQLHPERITELEAALQATLSEARRRRPAIFVATLDEIASWWLRRSRSSLRVLRHGDGRYHVRLDADPETTLLVRGLDVPRTAWFGQDAIADVRDFEAETPRAPIVGVSRRSPPQVLEFLAEEGLPCEVSEDPALYGAYVDASSLEWSEADVLDAIDRAPGPLVRVWRWPHGARSALAVTGDIDALTLFDFAVRSWETRSYTSRRGQA
jgi:peptidoglycan/xylan/chitin deacetylase (PgdA/CDA1 family)